jgi:DNA polymerase III epsilon subunit-like protein
VPQNIIKQNKMIYVSIDIETSGLNHDMNHVLSIGAIIEDTTKKLPYDELPKFNAIVLQNNIQGSPRAITMNKEIISLIGEYLEGKEEVRQQLVESSGYQFFEEDEVVKEFYWWLEANGYFQSNNSNGYVEMKDGYMRPTINGSTRPITINVAGKNFGTFDKLFLQELPWWQKLIRTRQRVLDPAILCVDWVNDTSLPSLTVCKERMNVDGIVTHNALEDAWDVIEILRKFY